MAKGDKQTDPRLTRKQMLIARREREKMRLVYLGLGFLALLVVVVLGAGAFQTYVLAPRSPVAIVNGTEISTGDYQTRARYERFLLTQQYQQILAQQASLTQSGDEELAQLLQNQYQQLASQTLQQLNNIDREAFDTMIDEQLIREDAADRGLTVSTEEVTEQINRFLASREGGVTDASASETATARVEATETAAVWTPTPTFTPSPTLTATESITPTATPADTPTPAPTPTFNIIAEDNLGTAYQEWLATLSEQAGVSEAEYRQIIETQILREKHREAIVEDVPLVAEQARARHILVETEEEANEVVDRLAAGEDFAELAEELSTDTGSAAQGGDLGFVSQGTFVEPIDEAVFNLPLNEVSDPIETQFGWHVVEVLERAERELSPADYDRSQAMAYQDWLSEARLAADIEDFWTIDKAPSENPLDLLERQLPQPAPGGS